MSRKKLKHFAQLKEWPHVYEPTLEDDLGLSGSWGDNVILELACGKGYYTIALAERYPEATLVGVDIKGARIWHGAEFALDRGLDNVFFLRTKIEALGRFFEAEELDEIWITFPDPHPRKGKAKKRLTSPRFLEIYKKLLKPGGIVHLKTDDKGLFEYTLSVIDELGCKIVRKFDDVYGESDDDLLYIKTDYERRFLAEGRQIRYVAFSF